MTLYCLADFKEAVERLRKNNSYASVDQDIIEHFFDKTIDQLRSGTLLNGNDKVSFIKKRLSGRGGFRVYYLLIIKDDNVYLMYVHPKTGSLGSENIRDDFKAELLKKVIAAIKSGDLYEVSRKNQKLTFTAKGRL